MILAHVLLSLHCFCETTNRCLVLCHAILGLADPRGQGVRTFLLGVQSAASKPCVDNQAVFIFPQAFNEFLLKASKDLGSPLKPGVSWRDYN